MKIFQFVAAISITCGALHAAVIGMNKVADSLTVERINALAPAKEKGAWLAYL